MSCYICRIGPHGYEAKVNGIKLHKCPKKNKEQRQKWLIFCCLPPNLADKEADKILLCTKHFNKEDITESDFRTVLRQNATPCFFPPIAPRVLISENMDNYTPDTDLQNQTESTSDPARPPQDISRMKKNASHKLLLTLRERLLIQDLKRTRERIAMLESEIEKVSSRLRKRESKNAIYKQFGKTVSRQFLSLLLEQIRDKKNIVDESKWSPEIKALSHALFKQRTNYSYKKQYHFPVLSSFNNN